MNPTIDNSSVEVTITWSDPDAQYLGSRGEETRMLTFYALEELLRSGMRDDEGNVVTSVTIFTPIPPRVS